MRVPHLNEFLKRARVENLFPHLLFDFSSTRGFCNGKVVTVKEETVRQVSFHTLGGGTNWKWGLDMDSVEIVSMRRMGITGKKMIIRLGRKCSASGVIT
jgi:hypothetical protein